MKFLKIMFFILGILLLISWTGNDCKRYFSGKWKYSDLSTDSTYVIRTLEKQTEYTSKGKYYYKFKIKWLNDCQYQLTYVGTNSLHPAAIRIGETLSVEIIDIGKTQMTYKTVFRDMQETASMEKIK